jgi:hypothetical protein
MFIVNFLVDWFVSYLIDAARPGLDAAGHL